MAINKVEYIKDSKTPGFATIGDEKTINTTTAGTIKEDVNEGNTENLTRIQRVYLNKALANSSDTTTYETAPGSEELPPDGENSSPTAEESPNGDKNKQESSGGNVGVQSIAGALFGQALLATSGVVNIGLSSILATEIGPVVIPTAQFGVADVVAGGLALEGAAVFDTDFISRMQELSSANEYQQTIDEYLATIGEDLSLITGGEEATVAEGEEAEANTDLEMLQSLNAQLEKAKADGDQALVDELTPQIEELKASIFGDAEGGIEHIVENNTGAHEVSDYIASVANFLNDGNEFGTVGILNTMQLGTASALAFLSSGIAAGISAKRAMFGAIFASMAAAAAASLVGSGLAGIYSAWSISEYVAATEAATTASQTTVAGGLFAGAAGIMAGKSAAELVAGNKGNELRSSLNELNQSLTMHDEIVAVLGENTEETEETSTEGDNSGGENGTTTTDSATGATGGTGGTGSTGGGASSTSGGASSTSGGASSTSGGASSTSGGASSTSGGSTTTA